MILLDTTVVSAVLRRRRRGEAEPELAARVEELLRTDETMALPGIVLQEVLSGIAERGQRDRVLAVIRESFPVALATEGDHLKAADLMTAALENGVALTTPDALIAAQLFTTDGDFLRVAALAPLRLM